LSFILYELITNYILYVNYRFITGNSIDKSNNESLNSKNKFEPLTDDNKCINSIKKNAVQNKKIEVTNKWDSSITKL